METMEKEKDLQVEHLRAGYDDCVIIEDMDICLKRHEITTLIGPNGCGKSTALKTITRILRKLGGNILLEGKNIQKMPTKELAKKISVLSQSQFTPADITVEELVAYGRIPWQKWYETESTEDKDVVDWALQAAAIDHMRKRRVSSLSGGERQRAWIATALAQKPEFLFLDEPTTYLDIAHQIEIMELVKELNHKFKIGIVMVLHDIEQAMEVSDQIIVLKDGKKVAHGTPLEIITEQMIQDVYHVSCQIIYLENQSKPVIAYHSLTNRKVRI